MYQYSIYFGPKGVPGAEIYTKYSRYMDPLHKVQGLGSKASGIVDSVRFT